MVRKPLVLVNGQPREIPVGDTLEGANGGGSGSIANPDAAINGFWAATDRLTDLREQGGMGNGQAYFHQVVAQATISVTAMVFRIVRSGSVSSAWVGLFDLTGKMLASGPAAQFMGSEGWKKAPFDVPYTIQSGTPYVLGVVGNGDNIPGFYAAPANGDLNQNISSMPLRSFRKGGAVALNVNQDFTQNTYANVDARPFLALVAT